MIPPNERFKHVLDIYKMDYSKDKYLYICKNIIPVIIKSVTGESDIESIESLKEIDSTRVYSKYPILLELGTDFDSMDKKKLKEIAYTIGLSLSIVEYTELVISLIV